MNSEYNLCAHRNVHNVENCPHAHRVGCENLSCLSNIGLCDSDVVACVKLERYDTCTVPCWKLDQWTCVWCCYISRLAWSEYDSAVRTENDRSTAGHLCQPCPSCQL